MKNQTPLPNSIDPVRNSRNRSSAACWTRAFPLILLALAFAWFALAPAARAVCQEGCLTNQSTALGEDALLNNTGSFNTAIGFNALYSNTTGSHNTANGALALYSNTIGFSNTATGEVALYTNTTGYQNTATGTTALASNTTGINNTANGFEALYANTGNDNTATGAYALLSTTTGIGNTAQGVDALHRNLIGNYNTASGHGALYRNKTGSNNTADGQNALRNTTGNSNIAIGSYAGFNLTTGSNNIDIFDRGVAGDANTIRIGTQGTQTTTFIAGISGATVPTGVAVIVDGSGHLGTTTSSARFKDAIKPMDKGSEAILALKPVTFRYKQELDPSGIPQFGLVAEEVEKVNPDLVARDEHGKPYTVRYEAVNAMLLNEFLKEHRKVEQQQEKISDLKAALAQQGRDLASAIARQQEEIRALNASLQKVNNQLELMNAGPRVVANDQ
jgi:Chaperone of endosialidase